MRLALLSLSVLVLGLGPVGQAGATERKELKIDGLKLELTMYKKSLEGTYFLTLSQAQSAKEPRPPVKTFLTALSSDGSVVFERSFEHRFRVMWTADFRPIGQGLYGYFLCFDQPVNCGEATYHFLDADFKDIYPNPVPNQDKEFDSHDVIRAPNGNLFFMFLRQSLKSASVLAEIQEWNPRGDVVFSWRTQDHLPVKEDPRLIDTVHINSIELDDDGGLLLSLLIPSAILKIQYPSGKPLWSISSAAGWKFVNDPLGGFKYQHSVRRLKTGNILLFDNGDGGSRPSRAAEYKIDLAVKSAELVWEYRSKDHDAPYRQIGGSVQRLSNGNTLIGWGAPPKGMAKQGQSFTVFTEVDPQGQVVRELKSSGTQVSYRTWFQEKERP